VVGLDDNFIDKCNRRALIKAVQKCNMQNTKHTIGLVARAEMVYGTSR